MATAAEVLTHLIPTGGWIIQGDDFTSIVYDEGVTPITKKQFDDSFAVVDQALAIAQAEKAAAKQAVLDKLGVTSEELSAALA